MQNVRAPYMCMRQSMHGACMAWPAGEVHRDSNASHLNDIIWRAMKRAQIPAVKEPVGLMRQDGKRPDGTTILPWSRGRPLVWDVNIYGARYIR